MKTVLRNKERIEVLEAKMKDLEEATEMLIGIVKKLKEMIKKHE